MNNLLRTLTVHSTKDLLKYKSFVLLIFFLIYADRVIHRFVKTPGKGFNWQVSHDISRQTAEFVFGPLPDKLLQWLLEPRVLAIAAGLFMFKQVISLWPSLDMRRMHRRERGRFGVMEALATLRWHQVAWDALAVSWVCTLTAIWIALAYLAGWGLWPHIGAAAGLLLTGFLAAAAFPVAMAGFSYSSKLAVIRQSSFSSRFRLFLELFLNWRLLWTSWLFFCARIVCEAVFVAIIPAGAILLIDSFWLRIAVAALSATPVYAFLKMASFKFFLSAYDGYDLVQQEYRQYYQDVSPPITK